MTVTDVTDMSKALSVDSTVAIPRRTPPSAIVFLTVVKCYACKHNSNEPTPFDSETLEGICGPCWPWLYGDHLSPGGRFCKLCPWVHRICGYVKDLHSLCDTEFKTNHDSLVEFLGALKHLVEKVNNGELRWNMKLRGPRKVAMLNEFGEVRVKTVEMIKTFQLMVKEKFQCTTYENWQLENPGKDPLKEGHTVQDLPIMGRGVVKCVVFRIGPKDTWDVDFQSIVGLSMKEQVSGADALSAGQADLRFASTFDRSVGSMNNNLQDATVIQPAVPLALADAAAESGGGDGEIQNGGVDGDGDEWDDDVEHEAPFADQSAGLVGSIFGCLMAHPSTSTSAKPSAKARSPASSPPAKSGRPASSPPASRSQAAAAAPAPGQSSARKVPSRSATPCPALGADEILPWSSLSVDVRAELMASTDLVLADETDWNAATLATKAGIGALYAPPFTTLGIHLTDKKSLQVASKDVTPHFQQAYKHAVRMSVKLSKRKKTPEVVSIIQYVLQFREVMKSLQRLLTLVNDKAPDVEEYKTVATAVSEFFTLPLCMTARYLIAQIADIVNYGETHELTAVLGQTATLGVDVDAADKQAIHAVALELGLARLGVLVTGKHDIEGIGRLQVAAETLFNADGALDEDCQADCFLLSRILLLDPTAHQRTTDKTVGEAYGELIAKINTYTASAEYSGILASLLYTSQWKQHVSKSIASTKAAFEKLDGATGHLCQLASLISRNPCFTDQLPGDDVAQFDKLCSKLVKTIRDSDDSTHDLQKLERLLQAEIGCAMRGVDALTAALDDACAQAQSYPAEMTVDMKSMLGRFNARVDLSRTLVKTVVAMKSMITHPSVSLVADLQTHHSQMSSLMAQMHLMFEIASGFDCRPFAANLAKLGKLDRTIEDAPIACGAATCSAITSFKNTFSIANAAAKEYTVALSTLRPLALGLFKKLTLGDALQPSFRAVSTEWKLAITKLKQLVQYSSSPHDDGINISYAEDVFALVCAETVGEKIASVTTYESCVLFLTMHAKQTKEFKASLVRLLECPGDSLPARLEWITGQSGVDSAGSFPAMLETAMNNVDTFLVETEDYVQRKIGPFMEALSAALEDFEKDTSQMAFATQSKTASEPLVLMYGELLPCLTDLMPLKDVDGVQVPVPLIELKAMLDKYDFLTVKWGVGTLLAAPDILRVKDGEKTRHQLQLILDNYPAAFEKQDAGLIRRAREALKIDGNNKRQGDKLDPPQSAKKLVSQPADAISPPEPVEAPAVYDVDGDGAALVPLGDSMAPVVSCASVASPSTPRKPGNLPKKAKGKGTSPKGKGLTAPNGSPLRGKFARGKGGAKAGAKAAPRRANAASRGAK